MTAIDQLARILALVPWLAANPGVSKAEAARQFDISVKQLDLDLGLATCAEIPGQPDWCLDIQYLEEDDVTVVDPKHADRPLRFDVREAVALVVGLRTLAAAPVLAGSDAVSGALAKLEAALGDAVGVVAGPAPAPDEGVADTVRGALLHERRLRIAYWTPARDTVAERTVDPLRVMASAPWTYLQAYDHGIGQVRTFRLDRVVEATELMEPVGPHPVDDLPVIVAAGAGAFPAGPHDVVVALDVEPGMRWLADYYPLESSTDLPGGGQRIVLRTPDARWAERFVLRLGGRARVVEPAEVRDAVRAAAAAALAQYE
jgi:proteasome accessory factor C